MMKDLHMCRSRSTLCMMYHNIALQMRFLVSE